MRKNVIIAICAIICIISIGNSSVYAVETPSKTETTILTSLGSNDRIFISENNGEGDIVRLINSDLQCDYIFFNPHFIHPDYYIKNKSLGYLDSYVSSNSYDSIIDITKPMVRGIDVQWNEVLWTDTPWEDRPWEEYKNEWDSDSNVNDPTKIVFGLYNISEDSWILEPKHNHVYFFKGTNGIEYIVTDGSYAEYTGNKITDSDLKSGEVAIHGDYTWVFNYDTKSVDIYNRANQKIRTLNYDGSSEMTNYFMYPSIMHEYGFGKTYEIAYGGIDNGKKENEPITLYIDHEATEYNDDGSLFSGDDNREESYYDWIDTYPWDYMPNEFELVDDIQLNFRGRGICRAKGRIITEPVKPGESMAVYSMKEYSYDLDTGYSTWIPRVINYRGKITYQGKKNEIIYDVKDDFMLLKRGNYIVIADLSGRSLYKCLGSVEYDGDDTHYE